MTTLDTRLAKWRADLAREHRQRDAALEQGRIKAAAEHQRQIDQLEALMQVHAERWRPQPAGGPVQTEMML